MDLSVLLHSFGSLAFFSSRAFLPAFLTAVSLRYGDAIPYLSGSTFIQSFGDNPSWFTSNWTILGLGVLAVLEVTGDKVPEFRQVLGETTKYAKSGMAALTYMGILSVKDAGFIENIISQASTFDYIPAGILAGGVYALARMRDVLIFLLIEADEDDDLGIQQLISWGEDLWSALGIFLLLLFPVVMLLLCGVVSGIIGFLAFLARRREEKSKVPCSQCDELIYLSALNCPKCENPHESPRKIGFLGGPVNKLVDNKREHTFELTEKKRCPVCATRFPKRTLEQTCEACGHELMADKKFASAYLSRIRARLPLTLIVTFVLSLVPVIGLIPGVIYYRYRLAGPFRRYIPLHRNFLIKILIQIVFILLIGMQWVPGVGAFSIPAMALISYATYGMTFRVAVSRRS